MRHAIVPRWRGVLRSVDSRAGNIRVAGLQSIGTPVAGTAAIRVRARWPETTVTHNSRPDPRPRRILLATDLSSRGDRAFDRVVQLSREWDAELHLVHAVEAEPAAVPAGVDADAWLREHPDPVASARRELHDLVAHSDAHAEIHVSPAPVAEAILEVADRERCDLVVLGESRERIIGPLESTLEFIVRSSPVSVLVVRNRPRGRYARLLVGTDFSDEAREALRFAADVFTQAEITLVHAYAMPYAGLLASEPDEPAWITSGRERLRGHVAEAGLAAGRRTELRLRVEQAPPAAALRRRVLEDGIDLTVIGALRRGMLFDAVVGSSRSIVDAIPGDVLVVRATGQPSA